MNALPPCAKCGKTYKRANCYSKAHPGDCMFCHRPPMTAEAQEKAAVTRRKMAQTAPREPCTECGAPKAKHLLQSGSCLACVSRRKRAADSKRAVDSLVAEQQAVEAANAPVLPAKELPEMRAIPIPTAELASRELSRRRLLHFTKRFNTKYDAGWVHEDICRRLERFVKDVEAGKSPRLLLCCPPRSGKSELTSRKFPPWVLGQHPDWEIIAASHTQSLAMSFSRHIRDMLRDPSYQAIFPDCKLDPDSQSVENWNSTSGGGYMAAGIGTGITGRGCFVGETLIQSNIGLVRIDRLVQLFKSGKAPKVLAYDHRAGVGVFRNVEAVYEEGPAELVEITTSAGREIRCTPEHPVFVAGRGYVAAALLAPGDPLHVAAHMPSLQWREEPGFQGVPGVLRTGASGSKVRTSALRKMWGGVRQAALRAAKSAAARIRGRVLLAGVLRSASCRKEREKMQGVRRPRSRSGALEKLYVLLRGLPIFRAAFEARKAVPTVRRYISILLNAPHLLQPLLRRRGARSAHVGRGELPLQRWQELQPVVPSYEALDTCAGQIRVRGVRVERGIVYPPHKRETLGQRERELDRLVPVVPREPPQIEGDAVAMVRPIRAGCDAVYDLQVERESNYFAGEILAHNCHILIVDDPVKDMEAADSQTVRDGTWEWYTSTAYTRLAPGGGILGILTLWNDDDWGGRVITASESGEGDKFEIVRYPAINEGYDEYLAADDEIEKVYTGGEPSPGAKLLRSADTALHPARYDTKYLLQLKKNFYATGSGRTWSALYQQNPAPEEGAFFTKDMMRYYSTAPRRQGMYVYQAWDFAITEKKQNDWTVCSTMLQDPNDALYELNLERFRSGNSFIIVDAILDQYERYMPDLIGFEDGQIWKSLQAVFERRCQERRLYPSYEVLQPLTDKMVRAGPLRGRMQMGKVYFHDGASYRREADQEMLRFPAGAHDDIIDARAWCVRLTLSKAAPKLREPPRIKGWRDRLSEFIEGAGGSHMSA